MSESGKRSVERVERVAGQPHLVLAYGRHAEGGHVVDRRAESDRLDDRLGAGLELPRHVVRGEAVEAHVADHLAAAEERRHLLEQLPAGPERADPGRAAHLVRGERGEVGVPRAHVGDDVRHVLAGVHQHERIVGVRGVGEGADVVERAEHVRHRRDREQARAVEELAEIREVELIVGGHRDPTELDAALGGEHVPWNHVGVVFHVREHDRVARSQVRAGPRVHDEVDPLGRVPREDDLGLRPGSDETGDFAPRQLVGGRGLLRDRVHPAVDVRVVVPVTMVHRIEHGERLLGRRGRVEIRHPLPVDLPLEQREVAPDRGNIERAHDAPSDTAASVRNASKPWASTALASSASPVSTIRPSMSTCTTSGRR